MIEKKFKAWNPTLKEMWDCDKLVLSGLYLSPSGNGFISVHLDLTPFTELIPLQYIGINEINRNDDVSEEKGIYEGDIVECSKFEWDDRFLVIIEDIKNIPIVLFGHSLNWRKIAGNIYENAELLNK